MIIVNANDKQIGFVSAKQQHVLEGKDKKKYFKPTSKLPMRWS